MRTFEEKAAIVEHCIELEKTGGDILGYLWSENYYTPRATWCNIQREWLGRKPYEFTDGKPKKKGEAIMKSKFIVTPEIRDEAIRIAINGGDPRNYLTGMGSQNGMSAWTKIRMELKKTNPETFAKLPKRIGKAEVPEVPEMPTVKVDGPLKIETPERNRVQVVETPEKPKQAIRPAICNGMEMTACRSVNTGIYYEYSDKTGYFFVSMGDGEQIDLLLDDWKKLLAELPKSMACLGVEL